MAKKNKRAEKFQSRIAKIAKENGLPVDLSEKVILRDHEINHLIPKKELVTMEIDITEEVMEFLQKFVSTLKVSIDAVVCAVLMDQIMRAEQQMAP